MVKHTRLAAVLSAVCCLCSAFPAWADPQGAIISLHFQDTGERRLVMAASRRGMVFFGQDLQPFRAFRSEALDLGGRRSTFVWVQDVDGDPHVEYVFAGDPSFVLDQGADPYFGIIGGCNDFFLGDALDDRKPEVFCRRQNALTVFTYDGQFLWEYSVTGMRLGECYAEDLDSDRQLEFACSTNAAPWVVIDIANEESVVEVDSNPASTFSPPDHISGWVEEARTALLGQTPLDLDGDGQAQETLRFEEGTLTLFDREGSPTGSAQIPGALYSLLVADLTGDGTPEIFLGGEDVVHVLHPDGQVLAELRTNPASMRRQGRVSIASVAANGLEDNSPDAARAVVEGAMSRLTSCYEREMGSNPFVRVGSMFHELSINSSGRVSGAQRIYSSVNNTNLESCVERLFEDLRFSGASQNNATVSLRLSFDFTDR
ncbi:MAG: AgmX/PglI C-terminal domain-containing protein [Bradymonadales bacterium]|nr:AgmX/PglI C-terminal domain-containing protein [Bradymonadales bacterium]